MEHPVQRSNPHLAVEHAAASKKWREQSENGMSKAHIISQRRSWLKASLASPYNMHSTRATHPQACDRGAKNEDNRGRWGRQKRSGGLREMKPA